VGEIGSQNVPAAVYAAGMPRYCVGPTMAVDWGEDEAPVRVTRGLLTRVFGYFAPYWARGLAVLACIAAESVLGLAPAVVFRALIDYLGHPDGQLGHVLLLVGAGVGAALAGGLIGVADSYLSTVISEGIVFTLRKQVFENLLDQSVGFFTRSRSGELMSRLSNDVDAVQDVVTDTVFGLARNLFTAVATLALMLRFTWQLTLVVLLLIPLVSLPARKAGRATYRARTRTQGKLAEMTAYMQEILGISGILLVKAFVKTRAERARFTALNDEVRRLQIRQEMIGRWFGMLMQAVQTAGPALIMAAGGYLVFTGRTTVGTVFVFATVLGQRLAGSLSSLATMHVNVIGSLAVFRRLFAYIDLPPQVTDAPGARELTGAGGAIRFDSVTFAYPGSARPALAGVSIDIAPGQLAALVGPSGAGKTTLMTLVPRFADPQAGRVLIDGHDLRDLTLESVGRQVGVVFQDTFLFHASLADNLRYARPEATGADLVTAAKAACLHDFAASLPDGYDTIVGERGHRLSGGEKQRVAIARAILKDPRILILDEATSHLDSVSEQLIQAALGPLLHGRTSLVIAHRLSTVLSADVVLVLDQGRLAEHGTHAELVDRGGLYATLYQRQFLPQHRPAAREAATVPT
jgi:ATP-binding cassette, subfamily B, bacterial